MFNTVKLSNKISVVYEQIPYIRSISCGVWIGNGSRYEDEKRNGISHFIEHMLFKGTKKRSAKQIADELDLIGGQANAFTTKECTCYHARTLYNHFGKMCDILSDMLLNSVFDETEIKKECSVITEEIDMYEDSPEDLVHEILQNKVFHKDSLSFPVIGTKEIISSFTKEIFLDYFENNYHQDNIIISVAGKFEEKEMIEVLEKYFGHLNRSQKYVKRKFEAVYTPAFIVKQKDIEQVHISILFPSLKLDSEYSYDLVILNTIFGGSMSSRLFQKIREEKGLSYSVYSYTSAFLDTGTLSIYAALNVSQSTQVFDLIIEEINRLFTDKITNEQLYRAKEQLKSNYLLSLESSSSRMNSIGRSKLLLDRILTPDEIIEKLDKVSLERMYSVAEKIFDFKQMSLSAVGNIKGIDFERMYQNAK